MPKMKDKTMIRNVRFQREGAVSERGSALVLALVVSIMLLLTTVGAIQMAVSMGKEASYELDQTRALAVAEGVTESAQRSMLDTVSNFSPVPASGYVSLAGQSYAYTSTPIGGSAVLTDPDGVSRSVQH